MRIANACRVWPFLALLAGCGGLPSVSDPLGLKRVSITTGIDDAATEVAFLDGYNPPKGSLVGLVPRGPGASLLPLPGLWEGTFRSYCLHAGVHQPGQGDGYVYAPLKGPDASIIRHILQNQAAHPELPQQRIQTLIWAILGRAKLSDMQPEIQSAARTLLSADEIDQLNGGALGRIPPELLDFLLSKLPPAVRQAAQTNAQLRDLLTGAANVPYQQLERIAAPIGELLPPPDSRSVPAGRWSYDERHHLFVRYFPSGYTRTRTQFYAPESFMVQRDGSGRISALADRAGNGVVIRYKPDAAIHAIPGDPGMKVYPLESIAVTVRDPQRPWETSTAELHDAGWVMLGVPNGSGKAAGPGAVVMQQRYNSSVALARQVAALGAAVQRRASDHAPFDVGALAEFSAYAAAFDAIDRDSKGSNPSASQGRDLFYRAWMSQAAATGVNPGAAQGATRTMASVAPGSGAGSGLLPYDPSGNVAQPGNTGKQRLAVSGTDECGANGADSIDQARRATKYLSIASSVGWRLGTGYPAPWGLPLFANMRLINFNLDQASRIVDAMSGRCQASFAARSAATSMAAATLATPDQRASQDYGPAWNELAETSTALATALGKANSATEQYRSALAAGDRDAALSHARTMATGLHASGLAMLRTASKLKTLTSQLRAGREDQPVTLAAIQDYQQKLKADGFSSDELAVAKAMGMSEKAIAAAQAWRLEPVTDYRDTTVLRLYDLAAEALQELGELLAALQPATDAPGTRRELLSGRDPCRRVTVAFTTRPGGHGCARFTSSNLSC